MSQIDLRASWNRLAGDYQREHPIRTDAAHYGVAAPDEDELRLLGEVAGKRILELGCGGGQCSIAFAREGAICAGVDLSDAQVAHARELASVHGSEIAATGGAVEFHQGEMASFLGGQPSEAVDIVFSAYAFQYVEDLATVFAEAYRVLRTGGLFVFSLDHPMADVTAIQEGTVGFYESYFARGPSEWEWGQGPDGAPTRFRSFHRTVGDFLNLLVDAGFTVERLLEPEPPERPCPWASLQENARYHVVPATIIWKARRPKG
jgi:SAM-dependent methyltransferase